MDSSGNSACHAIMGSTGLYEPLGGRLIYSFIHVSSCSFSHHFLRDINSFLTLVHWVTQLRPPLQLGPLCLPLRGSWTCFVQLPAHTAGHGAGEAEEGLETLRVTEPRAGGQPGSSSPFSRHRLPSRAPVLVRTPLGSGSPPPSCPGFSFVV